MLKTLRSTDYITQHDKGRVEVDSISRARCDRSKLDKNKIDGNEVDGSEVKDNEVGEKVQKLSKSKNLSKFKKTVRSDFFISGVKLAFIKLKQAFVKALISYYFDLKYHIRIETDALGYAIDGVLSQLTLDNLSQWHLVAFFS